MSRAPAVSLDTRENAASQAFGASENASDGASKVVLPANPQTHVLQHLLRIERDVRRAKTAQELAFLMANDCRQSVGARQVFVLWRVGQRLEVRAVSSLSQFDRQSPTIQWIEERVASLSAASDPGKLICSALRNTDDRNPAGDVFPFQQALLAPVLTPSGQHLGVILAVRESAFAESEALVLQRLAETCGHAWALLGGVRPPLSARISKRLALLAGAVAVVLLGAIPVPMTALAPAEIAPAEPIIVAAPVDGAIDQIAVDPNQAVKAGDILFRYLDTQARGALDVAAREVGVAEAKLRQVSQLAFVDPAAKRDLAVARSDLQLKRAEHAYALELHERTIVRAPRDGVAVFADKREFTGRPISTGQRVMELADPRRTLFRLQVSADDAVVLSEGASARIFMDADPLSPLRAKIVRAAPMARQGDTGGLVFKAEAVLQTKEAMPPLGHRGTAQISGERVSLAFYLLRRPIAALRQRTGL